MIDEMELMIGELKKSKAGVKPVYPPFDVLAQILRYCGKPEITTEQQDEYIRAKYAEAGITIKNETAVRTVKRKSGPVQMEIPVRNAVKRLHFIKKHFTEEFEAGNPACREAAMKHGLVKAK